MEKDNKMSKKPKRTYEDKLESIINEVNNTYQPADLVGKLNSINGHGQIDEHLYRKNKNEYDNIYSIISEYKKHNKDQSTYNKCESLINDFLSKIDLEKNKFEQSKSTNVIVNESETVRKVKEIGTNVNSNGNAESPKEQPKRRPNPHRPPAKNSDSDTVLSLLGTGIQQMKNDIKNGFKVVPDMKISISSIEKKLQGFQRDIGVKMDQQFNILNKAMEDGQTLPKKVTKLDEKIDKLSEHMNSSGNGNTAQVIANLPEDEKAIVELTGFMRDGLDQLENIARYYIDKQTILDKMEKKSVSFHEDIERSNREGYENGRKETFKELAKKFIKAYPTEIEKIENIFGDIVFIKYKREEKVTITHENIKDIELEIVGVSQEGEYVIDSPAILVDGELVEYATIQQDNE